MKETQQCQPHVWLKTTADNYRRCGRCGAVERHNESGQWKPAVKHRHTTRKSKPTQAALF